MSALSDLRKRVGSPPNIKWVEVIPADLVAAVRRGVESGTIEGEVTTMRQWNTEAKPPFIEEKTYLVIPVDGGES